MSKTDTIVIRYRSTNQVAAAVLGRVDGEWTVDLTYKDAVRFMRDYRNLPSATVMARNYDAADRDDDQGIPEGDWIGLDPADFVMEELPHHGIDSEWGPFALHLDTTVYKLEVLVPKEETPEDPLDRITRETRTPVALKILASEIESNLEFDGKVHVDGGGEVNPGEEWLHLVHVESQRRFRIVIVEEEA